MIDLNLTSKSPHQTHQLGVQLGELAQIGDIFLLTGNLGSGKTCLTQGIAWGIGVEEYAFSPSFVLIKEYYGRFPLYHIDLYRLESIEEIMDLRLEEYINGNGICVIEWAEKGLSVLPEENLLITLNYMSPRIRTLSFAPNGERYVQLLKSLETGLKAWN